MSSKLGKLLRHDSNGWKIVGYGLRNPWRWSFDRLTGAIYIGDVGQSSREEVDLPARLQGRPAGRELQLEPLRGRPPWNLREPGCLEQLRPAA